MLRSQEQVVTGRVQTILNSVNMNFNAVTRESIVPADVEGPGSVPAAGRSLPAVTGRFAGGGVLLQLPGPKEVSAACRLDIEERSTRFSAGRPPGHARVKVRDYMCSTTWPNLGWCLGTPGTTLDPRLLDKSLVRDPVVCLYIVAGITIGPPFISLWKKNRGAHTQIQA